MFYRDSYKCLMCGRSAIKDHAVLRVHHIGFREHDHSDRMGNLATVCSRCHDQSNHKPGGKLWEFRPELRKLDGAAPQEMWGCFCASESCLKSVNQQQ